MNEIDQMISKLESEHSILKSKIINLQNAIEALKKLKFNDTVNVLGSSNKQKLRQNKRIAWKSEIKSLFEIREEWSISDIFNHFIENGFDLDTTSGKGSISTTLSRLADDNIIEKVKTGVFRKKQAEKDKSSGVKFFHGEHRQDQM